MRALLDRVPLPADYRELISHFNGSPIQVVSSPDDNAIVAQLLPAFNLLPVQQVPQVFTAMNNLYLAPTDPLLAGWWSTSWVPFATDGAGDLLVVDAGSVDTAGAVIRFRHDDVDRVILASSLGE